MTLRTFDRATYNGDHVEVILQEGQYFRLRWLVDSEHRHWEGSQVPLFCRGDVCDVPLTAAGLLALPDHGNRLLALP
jgi:hypothetical protein